MPVRIQAHTQEFCPRRGSGLEARIEYSWAPGAHVKTEAIGNDRDNLIWPIDKKCVAVLLKGCFLETKLTPTTLLVL